MTPATDSMSREAFLGAIKQATRGLQARMPRLDRLAKERRVLLFGYGHRGQLLASQFQSRGIDPVIYDSSEKARSAATKANYETVSAIDARLPLVISAAQNQISLLRTHPAAYSLAECLYAFDFVNQCETARRFTDDLASRTREAYEIYCELHPESRKCYLDVLLFRSSLDVFCVEPSRQPLAEMWGFPMECVQLKSLCDVGAYDGDTMRMMAQRCELTAVLAIEPNVEHTPKLKDSASRLGTDLSCFEGGLWSHACKLRATAVFGGMVSVEEDPAGEIPANSLDNLATGRTYDYVKFDIEGAESVALVGAARTLKAAKAIALAAYHRPLDLFSLPRQLLDLVTQGRDRPVQLHFRHYSECFDDSIFYLV